MPNAEDIRWFKTQFGPQISAATTDTLFDLDMLTAVACQETGNVWAILRRKPVTVEQILALCVGDTLDEDRGRGAFPKTKAELVARPNGQAMFDIAREALVCVAVHVSQYIGLSLPPKTGPLS